MFYPIKLDKERNFRFGMRAINLIEKKFEQPIMQIPGMKDGTLTMEQYATVMWAGLAHEDSDLTPDKVMDLVDEYSSLPEATEVMWKALNSAFAEEGKQKNGQKAAEVKNSA